MVTELCGKKDLSSVKSWAVRTLFGATMSVGRLVCSMRFASTKVLPVPVAPLSTGARSLNAPGIATTGGELGGGATDEALCEVQRGRADSDERASPCSTSCSAPSAPHASRALCKRADAAVDSCDCGGAAGATSPSTAARTSSTECSAAMPPRVSRESHGPRRTSHHLRACSSSPHASTCGLARRADSASAWTALGCPASDDWKPTATGSGCALNRDTTSSGSTLEPSPMALLTSCALAARRALALPNVARSFVCSSRLRPQPSRTDVS
eukprot:4616051-Prymnesium_polylepis.1